MLFKTSLLLALATQLCLFLQSSDGAAASFGNHVHKRAGVTFNKSENDLHTNKKDNIVVNVKENGKDGHVDGVVEAGDDLVEEAVAVPENLNEKAHSDSRRMRVQKKRSGAKRIKHHRHVAGEGVVKTEGVIAKQEAEGVVVGAESNDNVTHARPQQKRVNRKNSGAKPISPPNILKAEDVVMTEGAVVEKEDASAAEVAESSDDVTHVRPQQKRVNKKNSGAKLTNTHKVAQAEGVVMTDGAVVEKEAAGAAEVAEISDDMAHAQPHQKRVNKKSSGAKLTNTQKVAQAEGVVMTEGAVAEKEAAGAAEVAEISDDMAHAQPHQKHVNKKSSGAKLTNTHKVAQAEGVVMTVGAVVEKETAGEAEVAEISDDMAHAHPHQKLMNKKSSGAKLTNTHKVAQAEGVVMTDGAVVEKEAAGEAEVADSNDDMAHAQPHQKRVNKKSSGAKLTNTQKVAQAESLVMTDGAVVEKEAAGAAGIVESNNDDAHALPEQKPASKKSSGVKPTKPPKRENKKHSGAKRTKLHRRRNVPKRRGGHKTRTPRRKAHTEIVRGYK